LRENLTGAIIATCFSYRKDELVIEIKNQEHFFLRIGIQPHIPYIILDKAHNIRDPHIEIFKRLKNRRINDIKIYPYDKKVYLGMDNLVIHCIFYGPNQNIFLVSANGNIESSFKKNKKTDINPLSEKEPEHLSSAQIQDMTKPESHQTIAGYFKEKVGGYNNRLIKELCFRTKINSEKHISEIDQNDWAGIKRTVLALDEEIQSPRYFIYEHPTRIPVFSLLTLNHLEAAYVLLDYEDLNKAWDRFLYLRTQKHQFQQKLIKYQSLINKRIDYLCTTLKKISDFSNLEEKKKQSEVKGHLLQTFSHEIKRGEHQVSLKNLFSDEGEDIVITLDPKLSVQENAAKYFSKYKNIDKMKTEIISKKDTYSDELKYWKKIYEDSKKIDSLKKVEQLEQILTKKRVWQKGISTDKSKDLDKTSFNRLLLDNKWEILIGKNAKNNDLLTFKFAHKYDCWLHAQGVPGSHVVIFQPDKNIDPPMTIIEKAASIAAYFSSAKTSSTVPVNYTKVKYVRKPRKAQAGAVVISHSKTIFVEPKKYL